MTAFVIAVTGSIFILMYRSEVSLSEEIMQKALNAGGFERAGYSPDADKYFGDNRRQPPDVIPQEPPPDKPDKNFTEKENNMLRNCFVVSVLPNGELSVQYQISETVSYDEIRSALDTIGKKASGIITISGIEYRYLSASDKMPNATYAFLDKSIENTTLRNLLIVLCVIGCGSIGIMFIVSLLLSSWAIKPVNEAWEKQKQFVADASHELKTPLTVIEANTDVLLSTPCDTIGQQEKWLLYIKSETQRMSKLVRNLLYIAKVDSAKEETDCRLFDISEAVTSVCLVCESMIFEKGKFFETEIASDLKIRGDAEKIKQLTTILIDNAVKHSDDGGKIYVALTQDKQKNKVRLIVANSGDPIPAECLEKIFERFYRVDKSRTRATGGSGLGLSIAKSIVDAHNGTIQVISNPGELIRFVVVL